MPTILPRWGGARFPEGVPIFQGKIALRCQTSWDAGYPTVLRWDHPQRDRHANTMA